MEFGHNDYRDYLAHHGVLGQKWGKRNGPPYPLTPGAHSISEKRAGWGKSLSNGSYGVKKKSTIVDRINERKERKNKISAKEQLAAKNKLINEAREIRAKELHSVEKEIYDKKLSEEESTQMFESAKKRREDWDKTIQKLEEDYDKSFNEAVEKYGKEFLEDSSYMSKSIAEIDKKSEEFFNTASAYYNAYKAYKVDNINRFKQEKERRIRRELYSAKKHNVYDSTFLKLIENKPFAKGDDKATLNKRLNEYRKYLTDPEKYKKEKGAENV